MKNIRELLAKADKKKPACRPANKKRYVTSYNITECDAAKGRNSKEDSAVISSKKDKNDWAYDALKDEYVLEIDGFTVMKVPPDMFKRLKPFQRDAVKWIAHVGPVGGILADDMGMGKTVST